MKIILVPVDLSEITDAVIEQAHCFARTQASHLHLLHVAPPPADIRPFNVDRAVLRQEAARRLLDQRQRLRGYAERLRAGHVDVSTRFTRGTVNTAILTEARRINADLIIIGSHNHGNIYHALFGGVGQKVMRNSPCPVMLVPFRCRKPVWQPLPSQTGAEAESRVHQ